MFHGRFLSGIPVLFCGQHISEFDVADFAIVIRDSFRGIPDNALRNSKECIVFPASNVRPCPYLRSALTNENASRFCEFSRVQLHPKALPL